MCVHAFLCVCVCLCLVKCYHVEGDKSGLVRGDIIDDGVCGRVFPWACVGVEDQGQAITTKRHLKDE